jgi:hypothetical protein
VVHVLAVLFALLAIACMTLAVAGMVTGRQSARTGWIVRALGVLCFAACVAFNVAAH